MTSLRGRTNFMRVAHEGIRFGNNFLQVRVMPNTLKSNRLGVVVPSKALKKAVQRNRIRRLIKEACRSMDESLKNGYDIVIMVRNEPFHDHMVFVRCELLKLFRQAGVITES